VFDYVAEGLIVNNLILHFNASFKRSTDLSFLDLKMKNLCRVFLIAGGYESLAIKGNKTGKLTVGMINSLPSIRLSGSSDRQNILKEVSAPSLG
jgi:hypothetical protein